MFALESTRGNLKAIQRTSKIPQQQLLAWLARLEKLGLIHCESDGTLVTHLRGVHWVRWEENAVLGKGHLKILLQALR